MAGERDLIETAGGEARASTQPKNPGAGGSSARAGQAHGALELGLSPGDPLGPYRLIRLLQRGVLGELWSASAGGRVVWLRVSRESVLPPELRARLAVEQAELARLEHPRIQRWIEAGSCAPRWGAAALAWVAYEALPEGEPLLASLARWQLDVPRRVRLLRQVAEAVQCAHERGVLHRHIAPDSIFVVEKERVALIDFGLALPLEAGELETLAPEQFAGAGSADARSDVYALGALAHRALTERAAFALAELSTRQAAALVHVATPGQPTDRSLPIDRELAAVLGRALCADRAARYPSAGALAEDLGRWEERLPVRAPKATLGGRMLALARPSRGQSALVTTVVALVGLGLLGSVLGLFRARRVEARVRTERDVAEELAYTGNLAAAVGALRMQECADAKHRLELVPARMRGWEWGHLEGRLDGSVATLVAHDGSANALYVQGGKCLLSGGRDGRLCRWERATQKLVQERQAHEGLIDTMQLSPDGTRVATTGRDGFVRVFRVDDLKLVYEAEAQRGYVVGTAWSADGSLLYFGESRGSVCSTDLRAPDKNLLQRVQGGITGLALAADGSELIVVERDGDLLHVDLAGGEAKRQRSRGWGMTKTYALLPEDGLVLGSSDERSLELRSLADGALQRVLAGHLGAITAVARNPREPLLATASRDRTVRVWDLASGRCRDVLVGHTSAVLHVAFAPDGKSLVSADQAGQLKLWELDDPRRRTLELESGVAAELAPAGNQGELWCANFSTVLRFDPERRELLGRSEPGEDYQRAAASADGNLVLVSGPNLLALFDSDLVCKAEVPFDGRDPITDVAWHPRSALVVSAHESGALQLRYPLTPEPLRTVATGFEGGGILAFDPSGSWLAFGKDDGRILVFETRGWQLAATLEPRIGPLFSFAWSADGRILAAGARSGSLAILVHPSSAWSVQTTLPAHEQAVRGLTFSPDGHRLASVGDDATLRLFDTSDWHEQVALYGHEGPIHSVAWSPDGTRITTAGEDGKIRFWPGPQSE